MRTILYLLLFVSVSCVQAQETVERYAFKAMLNGKIPVGNINQEYLNDKKAGTTD